MPAPENLFSAEVVGPQGVPCVSGYYGLHVQGYPPPPLPGGAEWDSMTPLNGRIGDAARVLGYRLEPEPALPGSVLNVYIYWMPLAQTEQPYTVFVHLHAPQTGSLAQQDVYPLQGRYDTTVWVPGRPFIDVYQLPLPEGASAGQARLLLGLYDLSTLQRLPTSGQHANADGEAWLEFGPVNLAVSVP
jgi:hypothetical protein